MQLGAEQAKDLAILDPNLNGEDEFSNMFRMKWMLSRNFANDEK